jgi:phosphatidylglycerophosphate synthase
MAGHENISGVPESEINSLSATRNSRFREITGKPIRAVTEILHKQFPNLTANDITALGVVGVAVGSALAVQENKNSNGAPFGKTLVLGALGVASALDVFDGSMARLIKEESPEKANPHGQLVDTVADRVQETTLAISRAISAHNRGDKIGEVLALVSGISNAAPSLMRAIAEARGVAVSESGKNVIGFFGTRAGRTITGLVSTVNPEIKGVPVQKILDTVNIIANTITAADRLIVATGPLDPNKYMSLSVMEEAEERSIVLAGTAGVTILAAGVVYALNKKH